MYAVIQSGTMHEHPYCGRPELVEDAAICVVHERVIGSAPEYLVGTTVGILKGGVEFPVIIAAVDGGTDDDFYYNLGTTTGVRLTQTKLQKMATRIIQI